MSKKLPTATPFVVGDEAKTGVAQLATLASNWLTGRETLEKRT
jgi:hypothetical protein